MVGLVQFEMEEDVTMQMSPILTLHICAGIVGLLSGAVAMSFRKGSRCHGIAGKVFVISMLSLGASAMYLAVMNHEVGNFVAGILTIYLVTTACLTARRRDGETSIFVPGNGWGPQALLVICPFPFWAIGNPSLIG
jgi:uncharacterized membrane protein